MNNRVDLWNPCLFVLLSLLFMQTEYEKNEVFLPLGYVNLANLIEHALFYPKRTQFSAFLHPEAEEDEREAIADTAGTLFDNDSLYRYNFAAAFAQDRSCAGSLCREGRAAVS